MKEREVKKENTADLNAYRQSIADHPVTIEEALMKSKTAFFNTEKLSDQFVILKGNPEYKPERGNLIWKEINGELAVSWESSKEGRITILEQPTKFNGTTPPNLYIAGIDSIDFGTGNSSVGKDGSNFAMVVKKRAYSSSDPLNNTYVAYVNYRPYDERDAYELALKLSWFYNARINLEMTRKEIIGYFRNPPKNLPSQEHRFVSQPKIIDDKIYSQVNKKFIKAKETHIGTRATSKINSYMDGLVKAYVQDYCDTIFFEDFLMEFKDYDPSQRTKFDLLVAIGLCELLDQELEFQNVTVTIKEAPTKGTVRQEWGYYIDQYGYKRYGKKPMPDLSELNLRQGFSPRQNYIDRTNGNVE